MKEWKYLKYDIEEWLKRPAIRKWINDNPRIVIRITIATISLFLIILIFKLVPYRSPNVSMNHKAWFYDLNTKKLFAEDGDKIPPIDAPSGKLAGVKAYVLSYVLEPNENEKFIAYLEKFTPQGRKYIDICKEAKTKVTEKMINDLNCNRYVSKPNDINWFLASSDKGREILRQANKANDKGQMPLNYLPKLK
ncbi:MAG: hypothetical protein A2Y12_14695 [Planctomycetes bacterium GWF2_42_9]|nr:MAG: hypothetical protein A2Y12_14695 [Planctomycetes bacterium GWF2_42_9]HAL45776.1 hypothetical protein [Phycisphaerales bacterium]